MQYWKTYIFGMSLWEKCCNRLHKWVLGRNIHRFVIFFRLWQHFFFSMCRNDDKCFISCFKNFSIYRAIFQQKDSTCMYLIVTYYVTAYLLGYSTICKWWKSALIVNNYALRTAFEYERIEEKRNDFLERIVRNYLLFKSLPDVKFRFVGPLFMCIRKLIWLLS